VEDIAQVIGREVAAPDDPSVPQSPGQLKSHYAPRAQVRLDAETVTADEVLLGFGPDCSQAALNLSKSANLIEAASNLFAYLRKMDSIAQDADAKAIAVSPVPMKGLGLAINDRLSRAAAPRN
jgi:L-threonylcarbamoyladenylate synthase